MATSDYSLQDLADSVGMEPRTIRSYIEQGLLRGPESLGRNARYGEGHLRRLQAIRAMKDLDGMSLGEIRKALLTLSEDAIAAIAERAPNRDEGGGAAASGSGSALDYLRSVKQALGGDWAAAPSPAPGVPRPMAPGAPRPMAPGAPVARDPLRSPAPSPQPGSRTPLEALLDELGRYRPKRPVKPRAKGTPWFRIQVTPDVELSVRGVRSPEELAQFERIADHLREFLLGGTDHENERQDEN